MPHKPSPSNYAVLDAYLQDQINLHRSNADVLSEKDWTSAQEKHIDEYFEKKGGIIEPFRKSELMVKKKPETPKPIKQEIQKPIIKPQAGLKKSFVYRKRKLVFIRKGKRIVSIRKKRYAVYRDSRGRFVSNPSRKKTYRKPV